MLTNKNIMPFIGVQFDETVNNFRVITYQAYNAMGLIGSESNGIAILDELNKQVLIDQHLKQNTSYFGMSTQVLNEAKHICNQIKTDFDAFKNFVNTHPRSRYKI